MSEGSIGGNFLGLEESTREGADIAILSLPYELTVSYGQGTENGPAACIEASTQVELHDPLLNEDLPAGRTIFTAPPWDGEGGSLAAQLEGIEKYLKEWTEGQVFPIVLGGEHGSLPAIMRALSNHPTLAGDLGRLTVVQVDAHADLRNELDGDNYSHACAARRALDEGVGNLLQIGVRAYSREEQDYINSDERVSTWFARDFLAPSIGGQGWEKLLAEISALTGPVWLTFDIDGLDGSLVPHTGTPVPGGLAHWQAVEIIETLFAADQVEVIGADVAEIVAGKDSNLTQFSAAMIATKIVAAHIATL